METARWRRRCLLLCRDLIMRWISHLASNGGGLRPLTLLPQQKSHHSRIEQRSLLPSHFHVIKERCVATEPHVHGCSRIQGLGRFVNLWMTHHTAAQGVCHLISVWSEGCVALHRGFHSGNSAVLGLHGHRWVRLKHECWWGPVKGVIRLRGQNHAARDLKRIYQ